MKMMNVTLLIALLAAQSISAAVCLLPDNGDGTVDFPPACPGGYAGQMVSEHFSMTTTLEYQVNLTNFHNQTEMPGGNLFGNVQTFDADLEMNVSGTGDLAGYSRFIIIPVSLVTYTAPRTLGDPVQGFYTKIWSMQGELFGDPDFCTIAITAGNSHSLNSPGHTTFADIGGGQYNVDSFFDVNYEIDFTGCPGSPLEGYTDGDKDSSSTLLMGDESVPNGVSSWSGVKAVYR